jgi:hypothetical protein
MQRKLIIQSPHSIASHKPLSVINVYCKYEWIPSSPKAIILAYLNPQPNNNIYDKIPILYDQDLVWINDLIKCL